MISTLPERVVILFFQYLEHSTTKTLKQGMEIKIIPNQVPKHWLFSQMYFRSLKHGFSLGFLFYIWNILFIVQPVEQWENPVVVVSS